MPSASPSPDGRGITPSNNSVQNEVAAATTPGATHTEEQRRNLANFDDLAISASIAVKSGVNCIRATAGDIVVHYPDGSTTVGLKDHIDRLTPQFVFAPDTAIEEHPVKLTDGNLTAVLGFIEGAFSKPMDLGNGQVAQRQESASNWAWLRSAAGKMAW